MIVCYFGSYGTDPRNRIIIKGLRKNKVKVLECQDRSFILLRFFKLLFKFISLERPDAIIVGFPGWGDIFIAKVVSLLYRIPVVYDAFMSAYDTLVIDRKFVKKRSLKAKLLFMADKYGCKLADIVLLDTNAHINYFVKEFNLPRNKFRRVLVGADDSLLKPKKKKQDEKFIVSFHGNFIPLQGIEFIIRAAKLLEKHPDIKFRIFGKGQTHKKVMKLAKKLKIKNAEFSTEHLGKKLPEFLSTADVCLGIFGTTPKANRVIPNKVYEAIAMKKPVITRDSEATRELLQHKKSAMLCKPGNAKSIAKAILELKKNNKLRKKIAKNSHLIFKKKATTKAIGKEVKEILNEIVKKRKNIREKEQ